MKLHGMRRAVVATGAMLAAAGLAGCGTSYNPPQPWCTISPITSSTQCFYRSREQCEATISGIGGLCVQNPELTGSTDTPRRRRPSR